MRLRDIFTPELVQTPQATQAEQNAAEHQLFAHVLRLLSARSQAPRGLGAAQALVAEAARDCPALADLAASERAVAENHVVDHLVTFGPLLGPMVDPDTTEVLVNGPHTIYVERDGKKYQHTPVFLDEEHLRSCIDRLLLLNPGKRIDESTPMVDVSLPDGSRVNIVLPPASPLGASVTIRRYQGRFRDIEHLRQIGTLDARMEQFLISCVLTRRNVLIAGSTGSGKTSLLDALAAWIPKRDRIVTIEDTLELRLDQPDTVRLLTRPPNLEGNGEIKLTDLFRNTLRMRPDRILLGEIRGPEALDFLQVLNAGVDGSIAVIHASSTHEAVLRLEYLVATAGLDIPEEVVRRQIADGLDIVVLVAQLADGTRKVLRIAEVTGIDPIAGVTLEDVFRYDVGGRTGEVLDGRFVATGYVPTLHRAFELAGLELAPSLYREEFA